MPVAKTKDWEGQNLLHVWDREVKCIQGLGRGTWKKVVTWNPHEYLERYY